MTRLKPAPDAILHLVKCGCAKERCSTNRCQCRKGGLHCTDLCSCSDGDDDCDNIRFRVDEEFSEGDEDGATDGEEDEGEDDINALIN